LASTIDSNKKKPDPKRVAFVILRKQITQNTTINSHVITQKGQKKDKDTTIHHAKTPEETQKHWKKRRNTTHKHHSQRKIPEKILKYQKIPFAHTKTPRKHKHLKISRAKTPLNSRKKKHGFYFTRHHKIPEKNTVFTLLVTTNTRKNT